MTAKDRRLNLFLQSLVVLAILGLMAFLLVRQLSQSHSHGSIKTSPGVPAVLRQVQRASTEYGLREGKSPSSLEDLTGITVLTSKGEKTPFSIKALELELGTNASAVQFFPEFRALAFGTVPDDENVLAYVLEFKKPAFCQVIFRNGKMQQVRTDELEKKIEQLRNLLNEVGKTNKPPGA